MFNNTRIYAEHTSKTFASPAAPSRMTGPSTGIMLEEEGLSMARSLVSMKGRERRGVHQAQGCLRATKATSLPRATTRKVQRVPYNDLQLQVCLNTPELRLHRPQTASSPFLVHQPLSHSL